MQGHSSNELLSTSQALTDAPSAAPTSGSGRGTRVAMFVVVLMLLGLGGFLSVRVKQAMAKKESLASERAVAQAAIMKKPPVETAHPVATTWKPRVELTGTLRPWREGDVAFTVGGQLLSINVGVGQSVRAAQVLATLDTTLVVAEVGVATAQTRAAQANLALAEDNLKRTEALVASKSIPEAQVLQAREQVALMRAQLDGAHASARVAQTGEQRHTLYAPFAGVVTKAPTAIGTVLQPAAPIVRIEDLSRFRLSANVGEEDASIVKVGAPVDVTYRDRQVKGRVTAVVPSLDQATRRAPIEIEVDNDPKNPLLAYGFVRAAVLGEGELAVLRVPPTARRPGSQDEVVKVEAGRARIVHVPHALDADGSWMVTRGLSASDVIVLSPDADVKDGDPVELGQVQTAQIAPAPIAPAK
jgi:RND family efflux transporter MFP subunit